MKTNPSALPALITARSQSKGSMYGPALDGGTGLTDYATFQLSPGFRIISDETLLLALAEARREGYDEAVAGLAALAGALS